MPQLLDVLLKRAQVQMLLDDGPGSAGLQVKYVLRISSQRRHAGVEVRALEDWTQPQDAASTHDPLGYELERARLASRRCRRGGSHTRR
jgi:hypothetical protein